MLISDDPNMNLQQKHLLNFVRRMNLNVLMFEELEDQSSPLVNFINSFTLNYIVSRLTPSKRQKFADLLEHEADDDKIWQFAKKHIKNFDQDYEEKLEKKLREIKKSVLSSKRQK